MKVRGPISEFCTWRFVDAEISRICSVSLSEAFDLRIPRGMLCNIQSQVKDRVKVVHSNYCPLCWLNP